MATPEEIAWAAGLFEGEGCLSTVGRPGVHGRQSARAMLAMRDIGTVQRFGQIVGIGTVYVNGNKRKNGRHLTIWTTTNQSDFRQILSLLWPWLTERRRDRASDLLIRLELPKGQPWENTPKGKRTRLTPEQKAAIQNSAEPYRVLAKRYGISYGTVARIVQSGPNWTDRRLAA